MTCRAIWSAQRTLQNPVAVINVRAWSVERFLPVVQNWYGFNSASDTKTWSRVVDAARTDGVAGLLWEALEALPREDHAAPCDVVDQLGLDVAHTRAVNEASFRRFDDVSNGLRSDGVEVLVLKGAALVASLYTDVGLRPMCDIDLLIHESDADRADVAFERVGYRRGRAFLTRDFYPRYHYEADYVPVDGFGPRLDVHVRPWRPLRYARTVSPDALWTHPREVTLHGTKISIPGVEDMLLHLACHTAFHGADRLLWLAEIDRYLHHHGEELDWDLFLSRAKRWSLGHAVWIAFERVEEVFGSNIPDEIRRQLVHSGRWRDRLATWQASRDRSHPLMRTMVDMVVTPDVGFRMGYLSAVLFPEDAHLCPAGGAEGDAGDVNASQQCISPGRRVFALARRAIGAIC